MIINNHLPNSNANKANPYFGAIKPEAQELIDAIPMAKEYLNDILPFVKKQVGVVLDYKPAPSPHFSLNWVEEKHVPERRKVSLAVFKAGGINFELSPQTQLKDFKDFLNISKIMVVYSLQSKIDKMTKIAQKHQLGKTQEGLLEVFKGTVEQIIKSCKEGEWESIRNNFAQRASNIKI